MGLCLSTELPHHLPGWEISSSEARSLAEGLRPGPLLPAAQPRCSHVGPDVWREGEPFSLFALLASWARELPLQASKGWSSFQRFS